jgi:hypothetical protein
MREWEFRSYKPTNPQDRFPICRRFPIHRACGPFTGSESDALAFARKACEHLRSKNVQRVEAWTRQAEPSHLPGSITFRFHAVGNEWKAEESTVMHPTTWSNLDNALDYVLWRGGGKLCRIELLNTRSAVQWLILSDERANDAYAGIGPTWRP